MGTRAELIGIGIGVFVIANAADYMNRQAEKKRFILQMGSPDNGFAVKSVRQLKSRGWLKDGSCNDADLVGANLEGADLSDADLRGVDLSVANLKWSFLDGVDLRRAELRRVDLSDAILEDADLSHAIIFGATLNRLNLSDAKLKGAIYNEHTIWPYGFDPEAAGAILGDRDLENG